MRPHGLRFAQAVWRAIAPFFMIIAIAVLIGIFVVSNVKSASSGLIVSLVAYYPFNGNALDESGKGNDATVNGAALTSDRYGVPDSAYLFDGIDDSIIISNSTTLSVTNFFVHGYTIAAWVKPLDASSGYHTIVNKGINAFSIRLNGLVLEACHTHSGGTSCQTIGVALPINVWSHVAVTWDSFTGSWKLYYNGIPGSYPVFVNDLVPMSDGDVSIGRDSRFAQWYFNGVIDEVRIYDQGLTPIEMKRLYDDSAPPLRIVYLPAVMKN